jgi:hypothetical protein
VNGSLVRPEAGEIVAKELGRGGHVVGRSEQAAEVGGSQPPAQLCIAFSREASRGAFSAAVGACAQAALNFLEMSERASCIEVVKRKHNWNGESVRDLN